LACAAVNEIKYLGSSILIYLLYQKVAIVNSIRTYGK